MSARPLRRIASRHGCLAAAPDTRRGSSARAAHDTCGGGGGWSDAAAPPSRHIVPARPRSGVIAPWNYPFYNLYNHISAALFSGNAVVLKMSEYSAWSGDKYIRVARDVLASCGHNPDLVQLVQGFGEAGAALVNAVDKVIFTGSPGIGKLVMRGASSVSHSVRPPVSSRWGRLPRPGWASPAARRGLRAPLPHTHARTLTHTHTHARPAPPPRR